MTANGEEDARKVAELSILWDQVEEILTELEMALPSDLLGEQRAKAWQHQPVHRLSEKKEPDDSLSLEALSRTTWLYLRAKWADSPMLECWLVRKMIYAETFAFSREVGLPVHLKGKRFWWDFAKSTAKWLIGVFVALAIGEAYSAGVGVLSYVAWICMVHLLARDTTKIKMQLFKLFGHMQTAYRVALRSSTYPLELERHVALAEEEGAVWPEGLRPLLHKAMTRSPISWVTRTEY